MLSVAGFILRFWWVSRNSPLMAHKLVKIFPHVNDTILLLAAISLSLMSGLYPFIQAWLGVKVVLLVGYIVAGIFALKRAKTEKGRIVAFVAALACVSLIFAAALLKPIV
jgi:uncharacterized membrane protein SirB2